MSLVLRLPPAASLWIRRIVVSLCLRGEKYFVRIAVNTRVLSHPVTGVERYTLELLRRFGDSVAQIAPHSALGGVKGHAWEQLVLPAKLRGRLLFSPCNTGPLAVANQVVTIHDVAALDHPEWLNAKFALWYRWLTPRLARRVKHIIAVSEFTRGRIVAHTGVPAEKITVIPNGVDARFAPMAPDAIDAALAPLALPSRKYILAVGSIEPRKNLPRLLEAWGKILPTLPEDVWLVVAGGRNARVFSSMSTDHGSKVYPGAPGINDDGGDGGDGLQVTGDRAQGEQNLESRTLHSEGNEDAAPTESAALPKYSRFEVLDSNSSPTAALPQHSNSYLLASNSSSSPHPNSSQAGGGTVRLLGFRSDVSALMAACDIFVLPAPAEPFGLVIIEAMALGKPVIAAGAGGPLEIVADGETGLLFAPGNAESLAATMKRLLADADLRKRMGEAGRKRYEEMFTAQQMAEKMRDAYAAEGREKVGVRS